MEITKEQLNYIREAYSMLVNRNLEIKITEENIMALYYVLGRLRLVLTELDGQKSEV